MIREHMTRELHNITRIRVRAPLFGPLIALSTCRCPGAAGAVARLVYVLCMQLFPYHSALGALIRKNPKPRLPIGSYSRPSASRKTRRSGEGKLHIICTPFFSLLVPESGSGSREERGDDLAGRVFVYRYPWYPY